MGQGRSSGGQNLGVARGSIEISTSQLAAARAAVQSFATGVNTDLTGLNASIKRAESQFAGLSNAARGMAGAFGVSLGVQGFAQLARAGIAASEVATAYQRQSVAARNLAGSQGELNELIEAYNRATGDAIDRATALSDVTRLIGIGFADSVQEIEAFARAVRGISIATGRTQDTVSTQLQMEMLNQTGLRLDQVGLSMAEVTRRAEELRATTRGLTQEQAYQQAVLDTANKKYGELTRSAVAQATGIEQTSKAWKDLNLQIGSLTAGPLDALGKGLAVFIDMQTASLKAWTAELDVYIRLLRQVGMAGPWLTSGERSFIDSAGTRDAQRRGRGGESSQPAAMEMVEAGNIRMDWARGVMEINRQLNRDIIDQERTYGEQRRQAVTTYQQTIAREAQDFATNRLRQEQDLANSIADIQRESTQREERMALDLARTISRAQRDSTRRLADMQADLDRSLAQKRADSAEKVAEWEADRDEAVAERRKESADRILELETDFAKERERAQRQYALQRSEAASRLDARALWELDNRFKLESQEAANAHREELTEEQAKLQEAIDQLDKAHAERLADEQEALTKSINQANEAHARRVADEKESLDRRLSDAQEAHALQLEEARLADAQRLEDMQADFAERTRREDEDRATRLTRMATDHAAQLTEMATQHQARMTQIRQHAYNERTQLDEEAKADLLALGVRNDAWLAEQETKEGKLEDLWDKFMLHVGNSVAGGIPGHPSGADPYTDRPTPTTPTQPGVNPGGGAAPPNPYGSASSLFAATSSQYTMPTPPLASTGTMGGGSNITIGNIAVYGAPTDSPADFAQRFRVELIKTLEGAARAYRA